MILTSVNIICSIICSIVIVYTSSTILNIKMNKISIKNLGSILLIAIVTYLSARIEYSAESILLKITLCIIILKLFFRSSIYKIIIAVFLTIAILSFGDILTTIVFLNSATIQEVRSTWYIVLICNILVYFITISLISIPVVKNKLKNFIANLNEEGKFSTIFLVALSVIVIIYLLYNISRNYQWSEKYFINIIIAITYFIIIIVFLRDKAEYNNLMKQYDCLFDYFKEFEDSIDDISLFNHEYKNQIAVLKGYIENNNKKDALKYINDIIKVLDLSDKTIISELKYIPKGGIKGLLYYKMISARKKNVTIVLDISDKCTKYLEKLTYDQNKSISKVLGVYIDNAIEGASVVENNIVNIEIYIIDKQVNIVISNSFDRESVNLNNISKKGYTTKGNGKGNGLYLVNKMLNRINWFTTEKKIINNYFIQRIIVKNTNKNTAK